MDRLANEPTVTLESKIIAPITWSSQPKFIVQDMRDCQYEEVLTLIKHHYFRDEPMCRSIDILHDNESVNGYLELIRTWMKDTTSLVAISTKSGRVIGTAIIRFNSLLYKTESFSRVQGYRGESLEAIMQLKSTLVKQANLYEYMGHDTYLGISSLCVHPSYKNKGVEMALLRASNQAAVYMKVPVVAGIFTSNNHQLTASKVGLSLLQQIPYNNWIINDDIVFDDPGIGNYSAAVMTSKLKIPGDDGNN